ncbi:MAG: hypothetical protein WC350_05985 [Candidatus Micrarchaeia archaeon]|jgi:hypothetical protein
MAGLDWKWWVRDPVSDVYEAFLEDNLTLAETLMRVLNTEEQFGKDIVDGTRPDGCRIEQINVCIPQFHTRLLNDMAKAERKRTGNGQPTGAHAFVAGIILPVFFHTQRKRIKGMMEAKNGNR